MNETHDHKELLAVYKHTIEDVERTKQWQWRFTYYTVIAQGAILALYIREISNPEWSLFFVFLFGLLGIMLILQAETHLNEFRRRMEKCREYFCDQSKEILKEKGTEKIPFYKYEILAILLNLFIVALIISTYKI